MTSTDVTSTALSEIRRMVSAGKISISEIMEKLAAPAEPPTPGEVEKPKPVVLSAADKKALRELPKKLADAEIPSGRQWTDAECEQLVPLFDQVKTAKGVIAKAEKAIHGAAHDHMDAVTDGPVGKNGHKITESQILGADDYPSKIIRYGIGGNAVELTDTDLEELLDEGKISLAAFRRMTKKVTRIEVIGEAVMAEIAKDATVLEAIASKARRSEKTTGVKMAKV